MTTNTPRKLDLSAIEDTSKSLAQRVNERFANRGIDRIAQELVLVAGETRAQLQCLERPRRLLRLSIAVLAVLAIVSVVLVVVVADPDLRVDDVNEWLALLENGLQNLVFIGIAALFVVGVERRIKRREALDALYPLRSLAHVIDMHQLTKDPKSAVDPDERTPHSPERPDDADALFHYLDYCSEMLSITNKLAALYAQQSQDAVVLSAVSGIQDLTTSLSSKVWQKIMVLNDMRARS